MNFNLNIDLTKPPPPIPSNVLPITDTRPARKKPSRFSAIESSAPVLLGHKSYISNEAPIPSNSREKAETFPRRETSHSRTSSSRDSHSSYRDGEKRHRDSRSRDSYRHEDSRDSKSRDSRHRDEPERRKRSSERFKREEKSSSSSSKIRPETERDRVLAKWRKSYCETPDEIQMKLNELANNEEKKIWIRSSPADVYYLRLKDNEVEATARLNQICDLFTDVLLTRVEKAKAQQVPYVPPLRRRKICRHKTERCSSSDSSGSELDLEEDRTMEELTRKTKHPYRLHADLWHNETNEMNDGPLCRCSAKSQQSGIRHGIYPGETGFEKCNPNTNNSGKLFHYRITISPPTNFLTKTPTLIKYDEHEFLFEGFSLFTHEKIDDLPTCKVIRFNIEYTILYVEEQMPENFTIRELDVFCEYSFLN